jgi:hypothetical protein
MSEQTTNTPPLDPDSEDPTLSDGGPDGDAFVEAGADRMPTPQEEIAADASAKYVDLDEVAEHAEEMMELGANVKGEGQIP